MDTQNGSVPFVYEQMWRVGEGALRCCVLLFPISAAHVPIGNPFLFCFEVLHFHVEDTVVSNECFEAFVVMSRKPVDGESSEAGTYAAQTFLIHERLFSHFIDCSEVVFHALAAIVATDGFVPFVTESRKAATVRGYNDIIVGSHDLEVPAVTPELADGALWATFAEK